MSKHTPGPMRRPRISLKVLRGIIGATSFVLAGDPDGHDREEWDDIVRADEWARDMRDWLVKKRYAAAIAKAEGRS